MTWLLLIYTVPSKPPGKRAAVWRDLKQRGAIYLRDGVAALPASPATRQAFEAIAEGIHTRGGQATLVSGARLPARRESEVVAQGRDERALEYREWVREAEGFLAYVQVERAHRDYSPVERRTLAKDLDRLREWAAQIDDRDYFDAGKAFPVRDLIECGQRALEARGGDARSASSGR